MIETVLKFRHTHKCQHNRFLLDEQLAYVECGICGEKLNPIWVLRQLCNTEARANRQVEALRAIANKAEKKNRCKCQWCGKMTRIQK